MGFRTVYGRQWSENGWRMADYSEMDTGVVPGTNGLRLPIRKGDANVVLKGWVAWFNKHVENLNNFKGYADEGSWTPTNSVASSNHLSGTAVDLNWHEKDRLALISYAGFNTAERAAVRKGLALFEGCIWWGQDWASPKDAMHFQLNYPEGDKRIVALADKLRKGYLGIWTGKPITAGPPAEPGVLKYGSSGPVVKLLQDGLNKNFPKYPGLPLDVDGDFGPRTDTAVREFQRRTGLKVDGIVGPQTRLEFAKYGVKL